MSKLRSCPNCGHQLNYLSIESFKNTHICPSCGSIFKNKTLVNIITFGVGILLLFQIDSPLRALIAYLITILVRTFLTYLFGYKLTGEIVIVEKITEDKENETEIIEIPNFDASRLIYLFVALIMSLVLFIIGVIVGSTISDDQIAISKVIGGFNLVGFLYFQWILLYAIRGKLYLKIKNNLSNYIGYLIAWSSFSLVILYVFDMFTQNGYEDIIIFLLQILGIISILSITVQYYFNKRKSVLK